MSSREVEKREARERREADERQAAATATRRRRLGILGGAAVAAVVVVVVAVVVSSSADAPPVTPDKPAPGAADVRAEFAGIPQRGTTLGRSGAPVTLVEYIDLKCPVCRAYEEDAFPEIVDKYVRTGKVRVQAQVQDFVGNQDDDSENAARMALAASRQNRFYPFAALFYRNQKPESTTYVDDAFLRSIALGVEGLDFGQATDVRDSSDIDHEIDEAARQFELQGFTGTPSFQLGTTGGVLKPFTPASFEDPAAFTREIDKLLRG